MTISPEMQTRLDKITKLKEEGYELNRFINSCVPVLKRPNGKSRRIVWSSPAGFSWAGYFWQSILYYKIKEYSYFYYLAAVTCVTVIAQDQFAEGIGNLIGIVFAIYFGFYFPYSRQLAIESNKSEYGMFRSIVVGSLFGTVAAIAGAIVGIAITNI